MIPPWPTTKPWVADPETDLKAAVATLAALPPVVAGIGLVGWRYLHNGCASHPDCGPDGAAGDGGIAAIVRLVGVAGAASGQLRMFRRSARADWKE